MVNSEHEKGIKFLGAEEYSSLTPVWPYHKPRVGGGKIRFGIRVHVLVDVLAWRYVPPARRRPNVNALTMGLNISSGACMLVVVGGFLLFLIPGCIPNRLPNPLMKLHLNTIQIAIPWCWRQACHSECRVCFVS